MFQKLFIIAFRIDIMILLALSIIDVLVGITLMFPNFLGFYLGIIVLLKGLSSMLGIPTGDMGIVIMGVIDIIAALMLLLNFSIPWFWLLPLLKGVYSLIFSFAS
jgi:ABC-type antimicrobial peptide transport system permease subunit